MFAAFLDWLFWAPPAFAGAAWAADSRQQAAAGWLR